MLKGHLILNTRAPDQIVELSSLLTNEGGRVLEFPVLEISDCVNPASLQAAISELSREDILVFTSANGVRATAKHLALDDFRIAVIGEKSAEVVRELGGEVFFSAQTSNSESLAAELLSLLNLLDKSEAPDKPKLLLLRGENASESLPKLLSQRVQWVRQVTVYRSVFPQKSLEEVQYVLSELVAAPQDKRWIVLTSSQAANNLFNIFSNHAGLPPGDLKLLFKSTPCAVIGPKTAATVKNLGLNLALVAPQTSVESLVASLCAYVAT